MRLAERANGPLARCAQQCSNGMREAHGVGHRPPSHSLSLPAASNPHKSCHFLFFFSKQSSVSELGDLAPRSSSLSNYHCPALSVSPSFIHSRSFLLPFPLFLFLGFPGYAALFVNSAGQAVSVGAGGERVGLATMGAGPVCDSTPLTLSTRNIQWSYRLQLSLALNVH